MLCYVVGCRMSVTVAVAVAMLTLLEVDGTDGWKTDGGRHLAQTMVYGMVVVVHLLLIVVSKMLRVRVWVSQSRRFSACFPGGQEITG